MKALAVLAVLAAGSSVGCRSYIAIREVAAERVGAGEVVVRFKADRDVTRSAQFYAASLAVLSQVDPGTEGADEARDRGHVTIGADNLIRMSEKTDPGYAFLARFPAKGEYVYRKSGLFGDTSIPVPYDLTVPGLHELEFWAGGGNCGGPGGFYTDRVKLRLQVP